MTKFALLLIGILFSFSAHAYIDVEKLDVSLQGDAVNSSEKVRFIVKGLIKDTQREIFAVIFDPIIKEKTEDSIYYPMAVYEIIKMTTVNKEAIPYGTREDQEYAIIELNDDLKQMSGTEGTVKLMYLAGKGSVVFGNVEGIAKYEGQNLVFNAKSMVQLNSEEFSKPNASLASD